MIVRQLVETTAAEIEGEVAGIIGSRLHVRLHANRYDGGRYGIENLANIEQLPATGATIFVGAPKHARGTGGPARVMAVI